MHYTPVKETCQESKKLNKINVVKSYPRKKKQPGRIAIQGVLLTRISRNILVLKNICFHYIWQLEHFWRAFVGWLL